MATIPNGAPDSLALIPEVSATTSATIPLEHPKMNPGLSLVAPNNRADSERRWWQVSGSNTGFLPIATDLLLAALSASIIFHISAGSSGIRFSLTNQLRALLMLYAALTILSAHSLGLYRLRRWNTGETLAIAKSVGLASILFAAFVLLAGQPLSLAAIGCMGAMNVGAFAAWRAWDRHTASHRMAAGDGATASRAPGRIAGLLTASRADSCSCALYETNSGRRVIDLRCADRDSSYRRSGIAREAGFSGAGFLSRKPDWKKRTQVLLLEAAHHDLQCRCDERGASSSEPEIRTVLQAVF